jgi:(1->4)-alpha-D-glucan 1-alpha-D-glucosylmutase
VDPTGEQALTGLYESAGSPYSAIDELARKLKSEAVTDTLASELRRLSRAIRRAAGNDHPQLADAIAALLSRIRVYRSDYLSLSAVIPSAIAETLESAPELAEPLAIVAAALNHNEPAVRLQQLCGAATAKSMEDCLFYRDARLVSLNEVGGEPSWFGVSTAEFHRRAADRARLWPAAMTTLTTHDTKRGEDVRARIGVLSQVPSLWAEFVSGWQSRTPSPDPMLGMFLLQNVFGVWPTDGQVTKELSDRLHAYAEKAMRESAARTSWNDPDSQFESDVHAWLETVIGGDIAAELTVLVARLDSHARSNALGQKLIQLTAPGIPDVYQGTELWEDSLVDPDNRRAVDFDVRRAALATLEHPKLRVTSAALKLRRRRPDTFLSGGYSPIFATGDARDHFVGFSRGNDVLVGVSRFTVRLDESGWGETFLTLPTGAWVELLSGRGFTGDVPAADLFRDLPVVLLERTDG